MAQTYNVIYSNKAYSGGVKNAFQSVVIGGNKQRCIRVPYPHHGRITALTIRQDSTDANQVGFNLELLKSAFPYTPDTDVAIGTAPNDDVTHYRIIPVQTAVAFGNGLELISNNQGYRYRNLDGTFTLPQKFIYLWIAPVSATTPTTWEFSITSELDVGP